MEIAAGALVARGLLLVVGSAPCTVIARSVTAVLFHLALLVGTTLLESLHLALGLGHHVAERWPDPLPRDLRGGEPVAAETWVALTEPEPLHLLDGLVAGPALLDESVLGDVQIGGNGGVVPGHLLVRGRHGVEVVGHVVEHLAGAGDRKVGDGRTGCPGATYTIEREATDLGRPYLLYACRGVLELPLLMPVLDIELLLPRDDRG